MALAATTAVDSSSNTKSAVIEIYAPNPQQPTAEGEQCLVHLSIFSYIFELANAF